MEVREACQSLAGVFALLATRENDRDVFLVVGHCMRRGGESMSPGQIQSVADINTVFERSSAIKGLVDDGLLCYVEEPMCVNHEPESSDELTLTKKGKMVFELIFD